MMERVSSYRSISLLLQLCANLLRVLRRRVVLVIFAVVFVMWSQYFLQLKAKNKLGLRVGVTGNSDANTTILLKFVDHLGGPKNGETKAERLACKLPKLNPYHDSVLPHIRKLGELDCGTSYSKFENNVLYVEGDWISSVKYHTIERPSSDDFSSMLSKPVVLKNTAEQKERLGEFRAIKTGRSGCVTHRKSKKCLHPFGGVTYPAVGTKIVFHSDCCFSRIHFKMESTGVIRHVGSGLCLHGNASNGTTDVRIDSKCTTKFTSEDGVLRITGSGMCLHPRSNGDAPQNDESLSLSTNCSAAFDFKTVKSLSFKGSANVNSDFIKVDISRKGMDDVVELHMNTALKPEVLKRRVEPAGIPVNVALIMFDSTSAANFKRKMKKTDMFIKRLPTVFLQGETIVGDGTTAQLAAMLTGIAEEDQPEARRKMPNSKPCDDWRFIFRDFAKRGYVTMYSEDNPGLGTFNYRLHGFKTPPTDHYGRYFWFEAEKYLAKSQCIGSERYHVLTMRYLLSLFRTYQKNPKFAFLLFSEVGHDDLNTVEYADSDLEHLLATMERESFLNNTIVFIFGDHGKRFGPLRMTLQGKLEERLPHMSVTFPKWFPGSYPKLYANFQRNAKLLTTPFDIYATLQHIISYPLPPKGIKTGQSLFDPIDAQKRTCAVSGVEEHWCPCLRFERIDVTDPVIKKVTNFALEHINKLLNFDEKVQKLCHQLSLKEIKTALQDLPNAKLQTFEISYEDHRCDSCGVRTGEKAQNTMVNDALYQIQFTTAPNNGFFEASVKMRNGEPTITGQISRLDRFGNQPYCIKHTYVHLIKFCYCK